MSQPNMLHAFIADANVADRHGSAIKRRPTRRRHVLLLALLLGGLL